MKELKFSLNEQDFQVIMDALNEAVGIHKLKGGPFINVATKLLTQSSEQLREVHKKDTPEGEKVTQMINKTNAKAKK